jgi:hypothetical protein
MIALVFTLTTINAWNLAITMRTEVGKYQPKAGPVYQILDRNMLSKHRMDYVEVGTPIADRPPRRSVRARLRIRLLPWMNGGETCCLPHTVQSLGHQAVAE